MIAKQKRTKRNLGIGCLVLFALMLGFSAVVFEQCAYRGESGREPTIEQQKYAALERRIGQLPQLQNTPQWSSDGRTIVVDLGEIYGVSVDGSSMWNIPSNDLNHRSTALSAPSMSPDGRVAFRNYYFNEGSLFGSNRREFSIETVNIDGTNVEKVGSFGDEVDRPTWSPDGSRIAFTTRKGSQYHMGTVAADGSSVKYLTEIAYSNEEVIPFWSNNGQRIAHVASDVTDNNGVSRIVNARWDGADEKIAMEQKSSIGEFEPTSLAWSPADERIYFVYYEKMDGEDSGFTPSVRSVRPDGSDERIIALLWEDFRIRDLKLSPDGSRFIFTGYRSPGTRDEARLYALNSEGGEFRNIFSPKHRHQHQGGPVFASWSPDGNRIAVYVFRARRANQEVVYTMASNGSALQVIAHRDFRERLRPGGIQ